MSKSIKPSLLRGYIVALDEKIYRICGIKSGSKMKLVPYDEETRTYDTENYIYVSAEKVCNDYALLQPDGRVTISIVESTPVIDGVKTLDVIICLFRNGKDIKLGTPYVVCRQNMHNVFDVFRYKQDTSKIVQTLQVGVSVSQETVPSNIKLESMLLCHKLLDTYAIEVYKTDTLNDIIQCLGRAKSKIDTALYNIKYEYMQFKKRNPFYTNFVGYHDKLEDLLGSPDVDFMYDFYRAFGMMKCNYNIDIIDNEGGVSHETYERLSLELNQWIRDIIAVEYYDDIDLDKITANKIFAAAKNGFFIITYADGESIADEQEYQRLLALYGKDIFNQRV